MNGRNVFLALGVCLLISTPVTAGQPDNPQERRDLVEFNRDYQQALSGPSGFGQRISVRATAKNTRARFRNFGDYLQQMTSGPNSANDSGSGND